MRFPLLLAAAALALLSGCTPRTEHRASTAAPAPANATDLPTFISAHDLSARLATPEAARRLSDLPRSPASPFAADPTAAPRVAAALDAFAGWAARAEQLLSAPASDPAARAALLAAAPALLAERREALRWLIRHDPELALQAVASPRLRSLLPPDLAPLLETVLAGRGDLLVDIACGLAPGATLSPELPGSGLTRTLVYEGSEYRAFTHGLRLDLATKRDLPFQGVAVDDLVAIRDTGVLPADPADPLAARLLDERGLPAPAGPAYFLGDELRSAASPQAIELASAEQIAAETVAGPEGAFADSPWTEGAKTLLFIRVAWSDSLEGWEPLTLSLAQSRMETVAQFFRENSQELMTLSTTFTPTVRLPRTASDYGALGWTTLLADARAAALAAGYPHNNYTFYTVASGSVPGYTWGGRAFVGGTASHLHNDFTLRVIAHELGHNLGLQHANYNYTPSENPLSRSAYAHAPNNSPSQGYGNRYDMMSANGTALHNHFSAREKALLDWLPSSSIAVHTSGVHRVFRHDHASATGLRALRAPSGDPTRTFFWLSHRRAIPGNGFLAAGAEFLWGNTNASGQSHLLIDTTPFSDDGPHRDSNTADDNDKVDAALTVGRMFGNPDNGVWFTVLGQGGSAPAEWIDVAVEIGNFSRNRPPVVALSPATATVSTNQSLTLTATASDPDGHPVTLSWDFGDGSFAGDQTSVTKSWSSSGHRVVRVVAVDRRGGVASARSVVRVGSPSTFTASGRVLDADGQPVEGVRVHNGIVGTGYRGSRTDSDGRFTVPNLASGSHTLEARKEGYTFEPLFTNPATVTTATTGLDFVAISQPAPFVIVDNSDTSAAGFSLTGSWTSSSAVFGYFGGNNLHDNNGGKGQRSATFRPNLSAPGIYRVFIRHTSTSARATNVPVDIVHSNGAGGLATTTVTVNQRINGGTWFPLGTYALPAGPDALVRIRNDGTDGFVVADAVRFELATNQPPTVRLSAPQPVAQERGLVPATLRIERDGDLDPSLVVHLAPLAVDGDTDGDAPLATPGLDYTTPPATVALAAQASSADILITPRADTLAEGDELAGFTLLPPPAPAQLWDFNEAAGTSLTGVSNAIDGGLSWNTDITDITTTGTGSLRVRYHNANTSASSYVPFSPALTGVWHLVLETTGWTFSGSDATEVFRFGFMTGTNITITAQAVLRRTTAGVELGGEAFGGGVAIPSTLITPSINTSDPYTFVLTVDATARTYRLAWRAGASGPFTVVGSAAIDPTRALGALRLNVANLFASTTSERLDIGRITLGRADPTHTPYLIGSPAEAFILIRDDPRDDWRFRRFTAEQLANPAISGWAADPDGDGLNNFTEYAFGRSPLVPDSTALTTPLTVQIGDARHLAIRFVRRADASGLAYFPEATGDLANPLWPDTALMFGAPVATEDPDYEEVTFRDPQPLGPTTRRFLRVRVNGN